MAAAGPVAGEIIAANAGTAATPSAAGASSGAATPGATGASSGAATPSATPATASPNTALNPGADVSATPATPKPEPQNANDEESEKNSGKANQQEPKNDKKREGQDNSLAPASTWAQSMGAIEEDAKKVKDSVENLAGTGAINKAVTDVASKVAGLPAAGINAVKDMALNGLEKGLTAGANSKSTPSPTANIPGLPQNGQEASEPSSAPAPTHAGPRIGRG